ncbi:MAG: dihydroxy-acid dehydratase, partial [Bacteroidota bacterium]
MAELNRYSKTLTQRKSQGASQAMLYATGMTEADMHKPQVGIASVWYEGNPCNMHLLGLGMEVKKGVEAADMVGMRFNTVGVSDGISMGTDGMSYSLQSRDLIADSIETLMGGQWYDALVALPGCDKNMPGCMIALGRLNRPGLIVYGGTIQPGRGPNGEPLDVVSAFQSYGAYLAGKITEEERRYILQHSIPGPGACGGMYTANTMASAIEALGLSLPYSSSRAAIKASKREECLRAGRAVRHLLERDLKPRDIVNRQSFENAITLI